MGKLRQKRAVFLDIDGVLVHPKGRCIATPRCVANLNRITDATGAVIVVSSTWRRMGLNKMRRQLREWGVAGWCGGITPDLSYESGQLVVGVERGEEIDRWLKVHPANWNFVILDDGDDMGQYLPHLVKTDPHVGLSEADADRAIQLLLRQQGL